MNNPITLQAVGDDRRAEGMILWPGPYRRFNNVRGIPCYDTIGEQLRIKAFEIE